MCCSMLVYHLWNRSCIIYQYYPFTLVVIIIECLLYSYLPSIINFYLFLPFMISLLEPTMLELLCGGVRMHCLMMPQSQSQLPAETRQVTEVCEDTDC